ncbi:uncharacterized protein LOC144475771 [Augochlora pura]
MSSGIDEEFKNMILGSDEYENDANDKVTSNDAEQKRDENRETTYCSNLEAEVSKEQIESCVPSCSEEIIRKSKVSNGTKLKRKFSCNSNDCTSITEDEPHSKVRISEQESLYFKSNVTMILNELKEICSEYELKTEQVRWKHLKKELVYQASANSVIEKSKNVIKKLKIKVNNQENKLMDFCKEWNERCCARNTCQDESLDIIEIPSTTDRSERTLLAEEGSAVVNSTSCNETFFENDVIEAAAENNETNENSLSVIILDDEETDNDENIISSTEIGPMSPILGRKMLLPNATASRKRGIIHKCTDNSEKIQENLINNSSEGLLEESVTENGTIESTLRKEQTPLEEPEIFLLGENNEEINGKSDQKRNEASSKTDDSESIVIVRGDTQNCSDKLDDDEAQADIDDLRCKDDIGTVVNTDITTEKFDKESDTDSDIIKKARDTTINISHDDNIIDITFSDSSSNDSMNSSSTFVIYHGNREPFDDSEKNKRAKALLLNSSISEGFSTDYDNSSEHSSESIFSKKQIAEDELESLQKEAREELDPWRSEKLKQMIQMRMQPYVALERLPKEILEEHAGALEKSREHLDSKQIKSLINLETLERKISKPSGPAQSSTFKRFKIPTEREATLLDYLKKAENGELTENIEEDAVECSESRPVEIASGIQSNNELMMEADNLAKGMLLASDVSGSENQYVASSHSSNEEDKREEAEPRSDATKGMQKSEKKCVTSNVDDTAEKIKEDTWKWNKLLTITFSSSDSEIEMTDWIRKQKQLKKKAEEHQTKNSEEEKNFLKNRMRKIYTDSDDDDDLDDGDHGDEDANCQDTCDKKGRKNIRKIMEDMQVANVTKRVVKAEEARLQRIAHRQKLYDEIYKVRSASKEKMEKLVLDYNFETKEELVSVHPDIVKRLKPHQAEGIKFMWNCCFESLERIKSSSGSGCILAHYMGLGKCLQVIALVHTLLNYKETGIKTIALVCPLNTILNWYDEFKMWLGDIEDNNVIVYELTKLKKNAQRRSQLKSWHRTGGVLLISYGMFRNFSCATNKRPEPKIKKVLSYLIDPGPDLIVCDEGHLLKNEDTALSRSMTRIKTLRRIALTGTPLQNNLIEYHCMVQFVKPNLLGTKIEFLNRFVNPINNGQYDNSTENDVKVMKQRAYVLHKMLKGCVQRFNYSELTTPLLPPKQEYVISVRLTDAQIKMYQYYLDNFVRCRCSTSGNVFADYQMFQKICTHPAVMRLSSERAQKLSKKRLECDAGDLVKDITNNNTEYNSGISGRNGNESTDRGGTDAASKASGNVETIDIPEEIGKEGEEWWTQFIESDHLEDITISSKLVLLFGILKESERIGDKLLVFSQFLDSLTVIEKFLKKIDNNTLTWGDRSSWSLDLDYFRLDGNTCPKTRIKMCKMFNNPTNTRARLFLISTRAGGLGINLTAANRVILFDVNWNPSSDLQSIFRIYRLGQKKPSYVYRFLAAGTMEEKIYNRQVMKLSLSCRVIDKQQIGRHYRNHDLKELYTFEPNRKGERPTLNLPKDILLAKIFLKYKDYVENYHVHDSLLENRVEEELNEEERTQAWLEYEKENKEEHVDHTNAFNFSLFNAAIKKYRSSNA